MAHFKWSRASGLLWQNLALLLVLTVVASLPAYAHKAKISPRTGNDPVAISVLADPLVESANRHFYNLDYDQATAEFQKYVDLHPNDPTAMNHLLSCILMHQLYNMGAMNTGEYANDSFIGKAHRPADPKVKEHLKQLFSRAENIEEQELKANPNSVDAYYSRGVTRAQFAVYTALIERAWFSALRSALGARRDHEKVLELNPSYVDAKLVVGVHNYVVGSLPWSVKAAVSMVGLGGSKEKGLQDLREVANSDGENSTDAKVILCLFLRRERQYQEAEGIMQGLAQRYPRNYLFALENANLLRAEGKNQEAAATYRSIWQRGRQGKYDGLHYEMAAWGLGELLRSEKDYGGAAAAYELVNEVPNPEAETLQKANLAAGEMYDLTKQRDLAMKKYQVVVAENSETIPAEEARKNMRTAYRE